ncbi:MAG: DUF4147 domain-containing protein [Planctomycetes bacterium]|nr:DUF4147 domain-containing protein [Planctomycetota bacterium]
MTSRSSDTSRPPRILALRRLALDIFQAGVQAADPCLATRRALWVQGGRLEILLEPLLNPARVRAGPWKKVHALAFGKAACAMAAAVEELLPEGLFPGPGLAVTTHENARQLRRFRVLGAGHPLPDENGVAGAQAIAAAAGQARHDELVLVLISGGGSALLPAPAEDLALDDKIAATRLLLKAGADIGELNTVRKHLSALKGGGLARAAAPAYLHALILSDVIGDDLSTIASGPTVPDPTTFAEAMEVLQRRGVWNRVPAAVRARLDKGLHGLIPETPKPGDPIFEKTGYTLVGSNRLSLEAARIHAGASDRLARVCDEALCGEARLEAQRFAGIAREEIRKAGGQPLALIAGGETTVVVKGKGSGGRNQELALAFALAAETAGLPRRWALLSGGTDGRDGPTDAAGGLVDPWTLPRLRAQGLDPARLLDDNDSYRALSASDDLVKTGPTGTNVADLQIFLCE